MPVLSIPAIPTSFLQKWLITCLLIVVIFLPFMEFPKHFFSILFVIAALYTQLQNKTWRQFDSFDYLLLLWLVSGFIIASVAPIEYKQWKGAAASLFMPLIILTIRHANFSHKKIIWLLGGLFLGTFIATLDGFWQIFNDQHHRLRLHSVGHVNQSAIYLCLIFSISFAARLVTLKKPAYQFYGLLAYCLFIIFSILYTDSRGSALTMVIIGITLPLCWLKQSKTPFIISLITLVLIAGALFYTQAPIIKKTLKQTSIGKILPERQKIWNSAQLIWRHNPVFGIGIKNYSRAKKKMQKRWLKQEGRKYSNKKYLPYAHGHSLFFNTLAEQGLFGLSIIFLVLLKIILSLKAHFPRRESSQLYWLLWLSSFGAVQVVIFNGLVNTTLQVEHGLLFAIIIGLWLGLIRSDQEDKKASTMTKRISSFTIYKRLLKYVTPYLKFFIVSIFGFIIVAIAQPLFAELIKLIIDTVESGDKTAHKQLPLYIIGLIMVRSLGTFLGNYFLAKVSVNVVHKLRQEVFNHYTLLPTAYFDAQNSGHLISLITYNVAEVTRAVTDSVKIFVREGLTAIGLLAYLLWLNWQLTLVFFVIAPFIAILITVISKKLRSLSKNVQDSMGDMTHITSELVGGHRVVKCFGGAEYEIKRFKQISIFNKQQSQKVALVSAVQNPIMQLLVACALSSLLYLALTMMPDASTGNFIAYLLAAFMLPRPIQLLTRANNDIQKGIAAATDIFISLDLAPEIDQGEIKTASGKGAVSFENISFSYANKNKPALKNINLNITAGQTVAIVGASGSGKTTLTNLLPRFYDCQQGRILLDGVEINHYSLSCLREQIALVTQNITLFNDTVFNNIAYGVLGEIEEAKVLKAADDAYASEFIQNLDQGMQTEIGEHGMQLSGGQRQRLAIARALFKDAPLLILDEATSALDTQSERYIQQALEHVMANRTTIVIAHRLSTIEKADVILVMEDGEIIERGTHAELLAQQSAYAKLHAMQFSEAQLP